MTPSTLKRLGGAFAAAALLSITPVALAETTSLEMDVPIEDTAELEVTVDSGTVAIRGADIDHVSVRARITIDERLSNVDPIKAGSIAAAIKRSPPVHAEGDKVVISTPKKRTHQRYATIGWDIAVPRDASVTVHSNTGNVTVSGVAGPVQATSDSGEVTVAAL